MDKKDIYEHLAKIYLDASGDKKKKTKDYTKVFKILFIVSVFTIFGLGSALLVSSGKRTTFQEQVALVISADPLKINFNFDPAKKEIYSIDLKSLNLTKYNSLGFSVKNTSSANNVALRVQFTSRFNEESKFYIKNLPNRWQDFKINFSEFKEVSDWSQMRNLSFIVEEWNTQEKKGVVFIDNVRVLK